MVNKTAYREMAAVCNSSLFTSSFYKFFTQMQEEGIVSAKQFWKSYCEKTGLLPDVSEIFERLVDFYIVLGFVPPARHNEVVRQNEKLESENSYLREALKEVESRGLREEERSAHEVLLNSAEMQAEMERSVWNQHM